MGWLFHFLFNNLILKTDQMKKTHLSIILIFCFINGYSQWQKINYNCGDYVKTFLVNNNLLYAGVISSNVMYKDSGALCYISQQKIQTFKTPNLNYANVTALAGKGNLLIAGTSNGTFVSKDGGNTWVPSSKDSLDGGIVTGIVFSGNNIFACTVGIYGVGGLFVSSDQGMTWTGLRNIVYCGYYGCRGYGSLLSIDNYIIAGVNGSPTIRSDDYGKTWSKASSTNSSSAVWALAVMGKTVIAGGLFNATYTSKDYGLNWKPGGYLNNPNNFEVYNNLIFAATDSGVYYSSDTAKTWKNFSNGLPKVVVNSVKIYNGELYAGTNGQGIWKSSISALVTSVVDENYQSNTFLKIFPNPSNEKFTIQSTTDGQYSIINEFGTSITNFNLTRTNNFNINIENLNPGVYFIVGVGNNLVKPEKMVVIK
jgi:photosystem II stability/assembly factor-like uncharacterized protein